MRKIWLIATTEFTAIVHSKAFLFGLFVLPALMTTMIFFQGRAAIKGAEHLQQPSIGAFTRPFFLAVIDSEGLCNKEIEAAASVYNQRMPSAGRPKLALTVSSTGSTALTPEREAQITSGDLDAFVGLPAGLLEGTISEVSFYTIDDRWMQGWLNSVLNECVKTKRLLRAGLTQAQIKESERLIKLTPKSLAQTPAKSDPNSEIEAPSAKFVRVFRYLVPLAMLFLMFLMVMMSVQPLLTTVLEEKMSRISEVLLGMVDPFELMMGKLLGGLGASLIVAVLYVGSGVGMLYHLDYLSLIPWEAFVYFVLFLFPAVLFFGSVYLAVGAACSDIKDAQALLTPFMLLLMVPFFVVPFVLGEPNGTMSTVLSLLPPATPFLMLMRVSMEPGPPTSQVVLSLVLTLLTAALFVFSAGKIFRAGLLIQGKAPTIREMLKWVLK